MSSLNLHVSHGQGNPKVNHGRIIFVPDGTSPLSKGTFTVATNNVGTQGPPWNYTLTGTSISATLNPVLRLTDQGSTTAPHIHYSGLSGTVSGLDSSGNFTGVSGGGLTVAPSPQGRPQDQVDQWDASTTQRDHGHHHDEAKA
jgi:hypothetical protein